MVKIYDNVESNPFRYFQFGVKNMLFQILTEDCRVNFEHIWYWVSNSLCLIYFLTINEKYRKVIAVLDLLNLTLLFLMIYLR